MKYYLFSILKEGYCRSLSSLWSWWYIFSNSGTGAPEPENPILTHTPKSVRESGTAPCSKRLLVRGLYFEKQGLNHPIGHDQPNVCSTHSKANNFIGTSLLKEKLKPLKNNTMSA